MPALKVSHKKPKIGHNFLTRYLIHIVGSCDMQLNMLFLHKLSLFSVLSEIEQNKLRNKKRSVYLSHIDQLAGGRVSLFKIGGHSVVRFFI